MTLRTLLKETDKLLEIDDVSRDEVALLMKKIENLTKKIKIKTVEDRKAIEKLRDARRLISKGLI